MEHIPVLLNEVLEYLQINPGDKIIDATFNGGGHSMAILEVIKPGGKILGIELDTELFNKAKERFSKIKEIVLINDNYRSLKRIAEENGFLKVHPVRGREGPQRAFASNGADGILFDLGLSSWHLEESKRGFTFQKDEPLDMRYTAIPQRLASKSAEPSTSWDQGELTAREIINQWPPETIEKVLKEYGEEKFAKAISRVIVEARKKKPVISTFQLIEVIKAAVPLWYRNKKIHFATKTFQALRIAVNDELGNLESALKQVPDILKIGGRAAVISFHSLEDRIVKNTFRDLKKLKVAEIVTKKPIRPSIEEVVKNPRSRSAKLRVVKII